MYRFKFIRARTAITRAPHELKRQNAIGAKSVMRD